MYVTIPTIMLYTLNTKECNTFDYQKDWSQQVVPDIWPEAAARTPVTTIEWMREAELKHGRLSMLAVVVLIFSNFVTFGAESNIFHSSDQGWVAVDSGLRFPGEIFSAIPNSLAAHDAAVANGSMG